MIDHLSLQVRDLSAAAAFYDAVLAPLGGRRLLEFGEVIGYGAQRPEFWLGPLSSGARGSGGEAREVHVAFSAADRATVAAFHAAALATGAEELHPPRLWPEYHESYFGAFVRDPDGNNVEAVCHTPPEA
ncbi:VOC family protein [Streptomyces sp. NPDC004647]|uniref:VOC family protein n=1 Tax=Streptomyces sp. NPDC004647 TaxID=3154671 RepID=UPI0033B50E29